MIDAVTDAWAKLRRCGLNDKEIALALRPIISLVDVSDPPERLLLASGQR